jgi:hypothetical protein
MSAVTPIVLQKSEIAAHRFSREVLQSSKSVIKMVVAWQRRSPVSLSQDCLTPYILTSKTPSWSKAFAIEGPKRLLQHYHPNSV